MMILLSSFPIKENERAKIQDLGVILHTFKNEEALREYDRLFEADAIIANHRTLQKDFLDKCRKVKWVQVPHIGVERLPMDYLESRGIIATNTRGSAGVPISEDIMCKVLMLARGSKKAMTRQLNRAWGGFDGQFNLENRVMGILGTGDVGKETAKRAKAFGMKTIGLNTSGSPAEYFDRTFPTCDVNQVMSESDFLVCTIPPTPATVGLVGKEQLDLMKPTACIINISRASIFDEEALLDALKNKKIAGAALDVFKEEFQTGRLSPESPFWDIENIIITPHNAAGGDDYYGRNMKIIMHNIEAFHAGKVDDMLNVRDYHKGY